MSEQKNKYIAEFEKTLEIPQSLHKVSSIFDREARDFWVFLSILYSNSPAKVKRKITWMGKRYERQEAK